MLEILAWSVYNLWANCDCLRSLVRVRVRVKVRVRVRVRVTVTVTVSLVYCCPVLVFSWYPCSDSESPVLSWFLVFSSLVFAGVLFFFFTRRALSCLVLSCLVLSCLVCLVFLFWIAYLDSTRLA